MTELLFRKRKTKAGIVWEFRFEVASIDGKRKWFSKSGFKTKGDALKAWNKAYDDYCDLNAWTQKMLVNIAKAGFFSSDRTIRQYNEEIWKLH